MKISFWRFVFYGKYSVHYYKNACKKIGKFLKFTIILGKIKASWRKNLSKINNRPGRIIRYPRVGLALWFDLKRLNHPSTYYAFFITIWCSLRISIIILWSSFWEWLRISFYMNRCPRMINYHYFGHMFMCVFLTIR